MYTYETNYIVSIDTENLCIYTYSIEYTQFNVLNIAVYYNTNKLINSILFPTLCQCLAISNFDHSDTDYVM